MRVEQTMLIAVATLMVACGGGNKDDDAQTDTIEDVADVTPDATPDMTPDADPDVTPDADPDVTPDADPDVTPDADPDVTPDADPDVTPDVPDDTAVDSSVDVVEEEVVAPACGDDTLDTGEICDDGDTTTDPCDAIVSGSCLADCSLDQSLCGDGTTDTGEQCDDGDSDTQNGCSNSCTLDTGSIGDPCTCEGPDCGNLDPTDGTFVGCEATAALADSSRELTCLRSMHITDYGLDIQLYFPQGYCSLVAVECTGSTTICDLVWTSGDPATFSCPAGTAQSTQDQTILGATITTYTCHPLCTSEADCRWNEVEESSSPWAGDCGQYACLPAGDGGEDICVDARNPI